MDCGPAARSPLVRNAFWAASILAFFALVPNLTHQAEYELGWFRLGFELLPAGLVGVFFGAILAIHLSTISSHLNLGALYFTRDLYQRYIHPEAGQRTLVWVGRGASAGLGCTSKTARRSASGPRATPRGRDYVRRASLNGKPLHRSFLRHAEIASGGTLSLDLGPEPDPVWGVAPEHRPRSSVDAPRVPAAPFVRSDGDRAGFGPELRHDSRLTANPDGPPCVGVDEPGGPVLVNMARGPLVVEEALVEALEARHLGGAILDVTCPEPLPPASKLWEMPNVIITPHVAGQSARRIDNMTRLFCRNLRRWQAGEPLINLLSDKRLGFPIRGPGTLLWADCGAEER